MKQPRGTSLEFNFYLAGRPEPEPFARLVTALLELGAEFTGRGLAASGKNINGQPFADAFEPEPAAIEVNDLADFTRLMSDPDKCLIELTMKNAIHARQNMAETVTYLSIPQTAAYTDNHPLAVWSTWNAFSGIPEEYFQPKARFNQARETARKQGRLVYRRFLEMVDKLAPAYASITLESFLLSPAALRSGPQDSPFDNFYLPSEYFSQEDLALVQELYKGAYCEILPGGLYVSAYKYFNPAGKELEPARLFQLSPEVAKLIAKRVR